MKLEVNYIKMKKRQNENREQEIVQRGIKKNCISFMKNKLEYIRNLKNTSRELFLSAEAPGKSAEKWRGKNTKIDIHKKKT